jgi:hypothetical protein
MPAQFLVSVGTQTLANGFSNRRKTLVLPSPTAILPRPTHRSMLTPIFHGILAKFQFTSETTPAYFIPRVSTHVEVRF